MSEIAAILDGQVVGDGNVVIEHVRGIDDAGPGDLTFVSNPKYRKKLATTRAAAVLVSPGIQNPGKNLIIVPDPYVAFGRALSFFYPESRDYTGISEDAFIAEGASVSGEAIVYSHVTISRGARIEKGVCLYPGVYVGPDVVVGEGSIFYPNVIVYRGCLIGRRVVLHAGVVVGSEGFGFARPGHDNFKIPQVGIVQIDDDVEIGANTTIDRGTLGKTWIQRNVKIDNLVQIAHNVIVGENSVIVAQVGISGSVQLGKGVIIGGQAGITGHIRIGDHVMAAARAGIHKDVPANQIISGAPHMPHRDWLRLEASLPKLPEMRKQIAALLRKIEELEKRIKEPSV